MRYIKDVPAKGWRLPEDLLQRRHPWDWYEYSGKDFPIERYVFEARVKYTGYSRGRSSVLGLLTDQDSGVVYPITMANFDEFLKAIFDDQVSFNAETGVITEKFIFTKAGTQYGIKLYREDQKN